MLSRSLLPLALALAATAAAFGSAVANAATDSAIVYVNDGDVWRVAPDGSGAHALTTDGSAAAPYARPRLARDGSVWALKGFDLVHIGADGTRLRALTPPKPKDSEGVESDEQPKFLDVSPDGTLLAYGVENLRCPDTGPCNFDAITTVLDTHGAVRSAQIGLSEAAFVGNDRLVGNEGQFEGTMRLSTPAGPSALWYRDGDVFPAQPGVPREPAFSADATRLAALRTVTGVGVGVFTYKVPAQFGPPAQLCVINNTLPTGASPSFSPDGGHLVVGQKDGLADYDLSAVTQPSECASKGKAIGLAPAGASQPDWGTVPAPAEAHEEPQAVPQPPVVTAPAPPAQTVAPAPAAAIKLTVPSQRLGAIIKRGLKLKVTAATPVVVSYKGKTIGKATAIAGTVTVKLTAAGRKALRNAKKATLTITAGTSRQTVTVRR